MSKPKHKVEHTVLPESDLKIAPYNPRTITDDAMGGLETSIERFGLVQEIVVNRRTMHVVGGSQRLAVLRKKGVKEIPVALVDLPDDEEKALNVSLNNPHLQGEFTADLKTVLQTLDASLTQGLRTGDLMDSLEAKLSEADEDLKDKFELGEVRVAPPPKAVWALVVVPAEKFHEVAEMMEKVSRVEGVIYDQIIR
jgi:ParB-like chromosome segregation protein Spo0J